MSVRITSEGTDAQSDYREEREAARACESCPCHEETPASCVCSCYGCKFHCSACWCSPCQPPATPYTEQETTNG